MCAWTKLGAAGLQYDRHIGREALDHARQFKARFWTELSIPGKLDIGDQTEDVIAIFLHQLCRVFEIRTQKNFWTRLHAHQFVRDIDSFLNNAPRLLDELGVDDR